MRVEEGGHEVPEAIVRRRYGRGLRNLFSLYLPVVDEWVVYDNAGPEPSVIARSDGRIARRELE
jgi:predicted ABC-type ATPase